MHFDGCDINGLRHLSCDLQIRMFSFSKGEPSAGAMETFQGMLAEASAKLFDPRKTEAQEFLSYGPAWGLEKLREATADFLTRYDWPTVKEDLIVSSGASDALNSLISLCLVKDCKTVWVDQPTYHLAIEAFRDHGIEPQSLPYVNNTENKLDLKVLEERLKKDDTLGMVYMNPMFHNPTGNIFYQEARQVIGLLESHAPHVVFVSDEPYRLLAFEKLGLPPLGLTSPLALTLGSFSKCLAPGLRLGYVQGQNKGLLELVASYCRSSGGANPLVSALVAEILPRFDLLAYVQSLKDQCEALCEAISFCCPTWSFVAPKGGYFVWVNVDRPSFERLKGARGFALNGEVCWLTLPDNCYCFRFCFARHSPKDLISHLQIFSTLALQWSKS